MNNTIEELVAEIEKHDSLYWEQQDPEISDFEYDKLKISLEAIDPTHPILNKVHSAIKSDKKVKHKEPMLSLSKIYTIEELITWCIKVARNDKEKFAFQPKYDGCSGKFEEGILSTRGDGEEGEDISHKIPLILVDKKDYKHAIQTDWGPIKGEILITNEDFEKYKDTPIRKGGQPYKNSRNACAGILNRDDNEGIPEGILTLVPFDLISEVVMLKDLKDKIEGIMDKISKLDYPMDGIVIKLVDEDYKKSLGKTSSHYHGEIAFKFTNPTGNTKLNHIEWKMGKRKLTPRGHVDPVEISGITITHVNLHNSKYLIDNDICINDEIVIERAGDVIPDFVKHNTKPKNRFESVIDECPYCGHSVVYEEPELLCTNYMCHEKLLNRLCDSVVRVGIDRLGKPTVEKMINQIGVKSLKDIFDLTKAEIIKMDGLAESSTNNLFNEIKKVKDAGVYDWQILSSLNIHGIGRSLSKQILSEYTLHQLRNLISIQIELLPNMGMHRAAALGCGLEENKEYIDELLSVLELKQTMGSVKEDLKKICFTGKMPQKRSHYEAIAIQRGWEPSGSVNKDLDTLVCMDPSSGSSKMVKARKLGINIISVDDFMSQ